MDLSSIYYLSPSSSINYLASIIVVEYFELIKFIPPQNRIKITYKLKFEYFLSLMYYCAYLLRYKQPSLEMAAWKGYKDMWREHKKA